MACPMRANEPWVKQDGPSGLCQQKQHAHLRWTDLKTWCMPTLHWTAYYIKHAKTHNFRVSRGHLSSHYSRPLALHPSQSPSFLWPLLLLGRVLLMANLSLPTREGLVVGSYKSAEGGYGDRQESNSFSLYYMARNTRTSKFGSIII